MRQGHTSESSVLVTGGAGFIGSHLVEELIARGREVTVLDNLSSGRIENLLTSNKVKFVQGDVRDLSLVEELVKHSNVVFHLAEFIPNTDQYGIGHITKYSMSEPLLDFDNSARGSLNVLESARKGDAKVVFASTAAVYGEPLQRPINENAPTNPVSPYGASKLCGEVYANLYNRIYGLKTVVARLFNVYGPRQRKYVMYDVLEKLRKYPSKLIIAGSGKQERDFIYVGDTVKALIHLGANDTACGQTFNIGTGKGTSILELVTLITRTLKLYPEIEYTGTSWKGDIQRLIADTGKLDNTGFVREFDLTNGFLRLLGWFQSSTH